MTIALEYLESHIGRHALTFLLAQKCSRRLRGS
jgi:hypothetical protein